MVASCRGCPTISADTKARTDRPGDITNVAPPRRSDAFQTSKRAPQGAFSLEVSMLNALIICGTLAAYRAALYVLAKGQSGSLANWLYKGMGGGGPGEPED